MTNWSLLFSVINSQFEHIIKLRHMSGNLGLFRMQFRRNYILSNEYETQETTDDQLMPSHNK
jgi:hypothetical protein